MAIREGYTAKQVTRLCGIPYQTLNLWARSGFIIPSITDAAGRGSKRIYSFQDIVTLRVVGELRRGGVSTRALKRVVEYLEGTAALKNPLAEAKLVIYGTDIVMVKSNDELVSVLRRPGQSCLAFVFDIETTIKELRGATEAAQSRFRKGPVRSDTPTYIRTGRPNSKSLGA